MGIEQDLLRVSFTLVRFGAFVANALIFGAVPLLLLVLRPGFKVLGAESWTEGRADLALRIEGLTRAALVASAVATMLALLLQTALVATLGDGELRLDSLQSVLDTSFGVWNLLRLPVLAALGVLLFKRIQDASLAGMAEGERNPELIWWILWGTLGLVLFATWSFSGHAAVSTVRWAAIPNDIVHQAAGATWLCGIVVLAIALPDAWQDRDRGDRTRVLAEVVTRFSRLALVAIAVVIVTGTLNSFFNLERPGDLIDSGYGRTLSIKITLLAFVVALGAINHFYVRRRLAAAVGDGEGVDPYALFRKTLAAELIVGLLLMGSTGLLVGLSRTKEAAPQSAPIVKLESERGPGQSV